jgi:putative nucleotidyltransferase with HDIG domain
MYPAGHAQISTAAEKASQSLNAWGDPVRMSLVGGDLIVEDRSIHHLGDRSKSLATVFETNAWEGIRISASCSAEDLLEWVSHSLMGMKTPYSAGGITAGHLDLEAHTRQEDGRGSWPEGYAGYLPDANRALEELDRLSPEGIELARRIVRSISSRLAADSGLLTEVRRLKEFDEYTYTHALNVSIVSMAIARQLGVPAELTEIIALGGLCHDVGKAKIPSEILNKPGRLDEEERNIINRHPTEGANTLLSLPRRVHPLLPTITYQHHMHSDTTGYPSAPVGIAPHPASQLVEVADVFDALRTVRPYRKTISEVETMNILLEEMNNGKLHGGAVVGLAEVLGLLVEGDFVRLADGRNAVIVAAHGENSLQPLVETDQGDILDLSDPTLPVIAKLVDRLG